MARMPLLSLLLLAACTNKGGALPESAPAESAPTESAPAESASPDTAPTERFRALKVHVTLDGAPAEGALVVQPGTEGRWSTDASGNVEIQLDLGVRGYVAVTAAREEARIGGGELGYDMEDVEAILTSGEPWEIALERFVNEDNTLYHFQDPGDPENRDTTAQCGHCHIEMLDDWYSSAHRASASNVTVQDLYAGAAAAYADEAACEAAGGRWQEGILPGTGARGERCYLGEGALQALNDDCGEDRPCELDASELGDCAACHAPGIDGELEGRGLLEATGFAYSYGIHCDVCHKIEGVDLEDPRPGVAGKLNILRPSEASPSPVLGEFLPMTFGSFPDVVNPRMGSVYRPLFQEAELCAGCHLLEHGALVSDGEVDTTRWPDGLLPIQSTYEEWRLGPYGEAAPCQSCHMPPDAALGNSADLGVHVESEEPDSASGWYRPPGAVRKHTWTGPRTPGSPMLKLAAGLSLSSRWEEGEAGDELVVEATVKNVGAGHAIPTGEPMRALILLVEVTCDGTPVPASGGDAVPDTGGWLDRKVAGEDWTSWPGAEVGDVVRVVRRTGDWHDYEGFGIFGDGSLEPEARGLPVEEVVGQARILALDGDIPVFDVALPEGDIAYRGEGESLPEDGDPATARAGAAGFSFERVTVGADGDRAVPSFLAVDIASDNRLAPQQSWTSEHRFAPDCPDPTLTGRLYYRAYPLTLARERGWASTDVLMVEHTL